MPKPLRNHEDYPHLPQTKKCTNVDCPWGYRPQTEFYIIVTKGRAPYLNPRCADCEREKRSARDAASGRTKGRADRVPTRLAKEAARALHKHYGTYKAAALVIDVPWNSIRRAALWQSAYMSKAQAEAIVREAVRLRGLAK